MHLHTSKNYEQLWMALFVNMLFKIFASVFTCDVRLKVPLCEQSLLISVIKFSKWRKRSFTSSALNTCRHEVSGVWFWGASGRLFADCLAFCCGTQAVQSFSLQSVLINSIVLDNWYFRKYIWSSWIIS